MADSNIGYEGETDNTHDDPVWIPMDADVLRTTLDSDMLDSDMQPGAESGGGGSGEVGGGRQSETARNVEWDSDSEEWLESILCVCVCVCVCYELVRVTSAFKSL